MKAKRLFSVIIAMMLMLSCFAVTASAIARPATGNLHIVLSEGTGSTAGDGTQITSIEGNISGVTFGVAKVADGETSTSDTGLTFSTTLTTGSNGTVDFTGLEAGRYLVKAINKPASVGIISNFLVDVPMTDPVNHNAWLTDVYAYPKVEQGFDEPTITKAVKDSVATSEYSAAANGISIAGTEEATWKIEVTVPQYIDKYLTFEVSDTVDSRLAVVDGSLTNSASAALTGEGNGFSGNTLTLNFDPTKLTPSTSTEDSKIIITYKTTIVNAQVEAVSGGTKIPNTATVSYTNNPTTSHTQTSGEKESNDPKVYTGKLDITKVSSTNADTKLKGVEFTLTGVNVDPAYAATVATTNANGVATWTGLKDGTYTLEETKTIAGYELNPTVFNVTVTNGVGEITDASVSNNTVTNPPKIDLPLTGGMGVGMFAFAGLALAFVGGVYLSKTRKSEEC